MLIDLDGPLASSQSGSVFILSPLLTIRKSTLTFDPAAENEKEPTEVGEEDTIKQEGIDKEMVNRKRNVFIILLSARKRTSGNEV